MSDVLFEKVEIVPAGRCTAYYNRPPDGHIEWATCEHCHPCVSSNSQNFCNLAKVVIPRKDGSDRMRPEWCPLKYKGAFKVTTQITECEDPSERYR